MFKLRRPNGDGCVKGEVRGDYERRDECIVDRVGGSLVDVRAVKKKQ